MRHAVIYRYRCNLTEVHYTGSTFNPQVRHLYHLQNLRKYLKTKKGCASAKVLMNNDYTLEILKSIMLDDNLLIAKQQLVKIENDYIDLTDPCCMNKIRSYVSPEEKEQQRQTYIRTKCLMILNDIIDKIIFQTQK